MILQSVLVVTRVGSCRALCHATKQTLTIQPNVPSLLVLSALNKTITAASLMTSTAPINVLSRSRARTPTPRISVFQSATDPPFPGAHGGWRATPACRCRVRPLAVPQLSWLTTAAACQEQRQRISASIRATRGPRSPRRREARGRGGGAQRD